MDIDLTRNCRYGHIEKNGVNDVLCCYDGKICVKQRWCANCGNFKMIDNYTKTCKNYLAKENPNGNQ